MKTNGGVRQFLAGNFSKIVYFVYCHKRLTIFVQIMKTCRGTEQSYNVINYEAKKMIRSKVRDCVNSNSQNRNKIFTPLRCSICAT